MPRPYKAWLGYFPLDSDFFTNKKIKNLRRAHGEIGILTYLNILCRVYLNGYFYKFDDLEELAMDIAEEIASNQLRSKAACVTETINYLVERAILHKGLFEQGIISGVALQEQYVICTYKAKRKIKMDVHCLVDVNEVIAKYKENSEETQVNSEETQVNSEDGTQNKSKVNTNKNNINTTTTTTLDCYSACARENNHDESVTEPPHYSEIYFYFKRYGIHGAADQSSLFEAYNANRGWDCLPNWKAAADLWIARMDEH
jgi:hypothetical protein